MASVAGAAISVAIAHIAAGSKRIRVGAGGIMLPNHAPYLIAEQFGTLKHLFPGRIDLGLGRASGPDGLAAQAMGVTRDHVERFPQNVLTLQGALLAPAQPGQRPHTWVPGVGTQVPLWILGSSERVRGKPRSTTRPALRLRLALRAAAAPCRL